MAQQIRGVVKEDTGIIGDAIIIDLSLTLDGVPAHVATEIKDDMVEQAKLLLRNRANAVLKRHKIDIEVTQKH